MAANSYTRTQVRQELLKRWPFLGWAATADSFQTTSVTDVSEFAHTGYGSGEFKDFYINRYSLTGDDKVKRVSTLVNSTGVLSQDGTVYSDTSTKTYEILGVHPNVLDDAIATAQQKRYTRSHILLTNARDTAGNAADMDMETSGVSMWDGNTAGATSSATPTKVTGGGNVYSGTQALQVALSGANGYVRSASFRVNAPGSIYTCMIARADVGTVTLKLYDVTNGAYISTGNDVAYSGEEFAVLDRIDNLPSGCEEIAVEIRGTGASDVLLVDGIGGPFQLGTRRFYLPAWMNAAYKLRFVRPSFYRINYQARTWDAFSRYFTGDLVAPQDWFLEVFQRDINPYALNLNDDLPQCPVWLSVERSRADTEPLTTEAGTTSEDNFEELMAYVMAEVAEALKNAKPDDSRWAKLAEEYRLKEAVESLARPPTPKVEKRGLFHMRI